MKNLYTKNEFLSALNDKELEFINEGFFSKLFGKIKGYINKVQGGKEVETIYQKYLKIIDDEFKKKAQVDLHLGAEEQIKESLLNEAEESTAPAGADTNTKVEGDETNKNVKMSADALKKKQQALVNILNTYVAKAEREMNNILAKRGGAEKNPKLATIIANYKDQFRLDYFNAEIKYLEQSGDKTAANKIATERNKLAKELNAKWNLEKVEDVKIEVDGKKLSVGKVYRYKTPDGIKPIKVAKKSEKEGRVVASYLDASDGDVKPQNFQVANIDLEFTPEKNFTYTYWSKDKKKKINVIVESEPDEKGMVQVSHGENKFKVDKNSLGEKK